MRLTSPSPPINGLQLILSLVRLRAASPSGEGFCERNCLAYQTYLTEYAYALGSSLLLLLLGLVTRRLLVDNFGPQITTASQVVSQLFNFFSIAEFGVGSVISYRLYEQIAAKNEEKISKYMSMYEWATASSAWSLRGWRSSARRPCGGSCPTCPPPRHTRSTAERYFNAVSYFLITRRLMYTCTQQGYRCTQIDFCCNVLTSLAKIAVSLWFPNYVLYFSVTIFFNVTANLLIARRFRRIFPTYTTLRSRSTTLKTSAFSTICGTFWYTACPTPSTARPTPS